MVPMTLPLYLRCDTPDCSSSVGGTMSASLTLSVVEVEAVLSRFTSLPADSRSAA